MKLVSLADIRTTAEATNGELQHQATNLGRDAAIYLHWSAGRYEPNATDLADYHILILQDGSILSRDDYTEVLAHTWHRNTGAIGVSMACCYGASPDNLGDYPPTPAQIETMARVVAVLCEVLSLPIDQAHVMTHAEAADMDGYGPATTCERWDLWLIQDGAEPGSGGDILRGKAIWYQQNGLNS